MKKMLVFICLLFPSWVLLACPDMSANLNLVTFPFSAEQWVVTQSAKVVVAVDAALTKKELEKVNAHIDETLKKISSQGVWYMTTYNRSEGDSQLEQLHVLAEARLPIDSITDIRSRAEAVSRQGEKYSIQSIDYSPSQVDIEQSKSSLRNELYKKAYSELSQLNQIYPDDHFVLHKIDFMPYVYPMNGAENQARSMVMMAGVAASPSMGNSVSQKITMNATVQFVSVLKPPCMMKSMGMMKQKEKTA